MPQAAWRGRFPFSSSATAGDAGNFSQKILTKVKSVASSTIIVKRGWVLPCRANDSNANDGCFWHSLTTVCSRLSAIRGPESETMLAKLCRASFILIPVVIVSGQASFVVDALNDQIGSEDEPAIASDVFNVSAAVCCDTVATSTVWLTSFSLLVGCQHLDTNFINRKTFCAI